MVLAKGFSYRTSYFIYPQSNVYHNINLLYKKQFQKYTMLIVKIVLCHFVKGKESLSSPSIVDPVD